MRAEVSGVNDKINLLFSEYLPDNIYEQYIVGDRLFELKNENGYIYTKWDKLKQNFGQISEEWVDAFDKI